MIARALTSQHSVNDVPRTLQALRFAVERAVVGNLMSMPHQVQHAAEENDRRRQDHSRAQQRPNDDLDALIIPVPGFAAVTFRRS